MVKALSVGLCVALFCLARLAPAESLRLDTRVNIVPDHSLQGLLRELSRRGTESSTRRMGQSVEALDHYPNWYCDSDNNLHNVQAEITDYLGKLTADDKKTYGYLCEAKAKELLEQAVAAGDALTSNTEASTSLQLLDEASHVCPTSPSSTQALVALISLLRARGERELSAMYAMALLAQPGRPSPEETFSAALSLSHAGFPLKAREVWEQGGGNKEVELSVGGKKLGGTELLAMLAAGSGAQKSREGLLGVALHNAKKELLAARLLPPNITEIFAKAAAAFEAQKSRERLLGVALHGARRGLFLRAARLLPPAVIREYFLGPQGGESLPCEFGTVISPVDFADSPEHAKASVELLSAWDAGGEMFVPFLKAEGRAQNIAITAVNAKSPTREEAVAVLASETQKGTSAQKIFALQTLAQLNQFGPASQKVIIASLGDPDRKIRVQAGDLLDKLISESTLDDILGHLADGDKEFHPRVVSSLSRSSLMSGVLTEKLKNKMLSQDPMDRAGALEVFLSALDATEGAGAATAVSQFEIGASDSDVRVQRLAVVGFGKAASVSGVSKDVPLLINALESQDAEVRASAVESLGILGQAKIEGTEKAIRAIVLRLKDSGADGRRNAALALGKMHVNSSVAEIGNLLWETDPDVRIGALTALSQLDCSSLLPSFVKLLDDKDTDVAAEAMGRLATIGGEKIAPLIPIIASHLADEKQTSAMRSQAGYALGAAGEKALPLALQILRNGDTEAQCGALVALGMIGPKAVVALPELHKALVDGCDQGIQGAAITAVARIGPAASGLLPDLMEIYPSVGYGTQLECLKAICAVGGDDPRVMAALEMAQHDMRPEVMEYVQRELKIIRTREKPAQTASNGN